jgi:hypothetical protein
MCERKKKILPSLPFPVDKGREWMREGGDDSRGKDLNMNTASVAKTLHRELKKKTAKQKTSPQKIKIVLKSYCYTEAEFLDVIRTK